MAAQWQIDFIRQQLETCPPEKRAYWQAQLDRALRERSEAQR